MESAANDIAAEVAGSQGHETGVVRVATMEALAALVIAPEWAGMGIAALPAYAAGAKGALIRLLPSKSIWRDLWMTVHADNEYHTHIRSAVQFLKNRLPKVLDDSNAS